MKKKPLLLIAIVILLIFFNDKFESIDVFNEQGSPTTSLSSQELISAYNNKQNDKIISASGIIIKLLADDNDGSRHQKFIVRISPALTVLVAHNIDLAPRVDSLVKGEPIAFKGEYEWNKKGGVIHWTHHDPRDSHPAGWLKYRGKLYQ
jgi:hypothetical protein